MILEVDKLRFRYNGRPILDDVTLCVDRGELLAVLGPNGAGKTTLLRCINGILKPGGGTVTIQGGDVLRLAPQEVARRIGYVAQHQSGLRLTAFDAVLMGRRPHIRRHATDEDLRITDGAIRSLGLEKLAMRHIDRMSGGELQKVAIGRALVQEPSLLLLDEPTSSLDLKNQMDILGLIRRVVREHDVCAVMSMHNLNMALRWADKVVFLKDGGIFDAGDARSVSSETIAAVYGVTVEVIRHRDRTVVIPTG